MRRRQFVIIIVRDVSLLLQRAGPGIRGPSSAFRRADQRRPSGLSGPFPSQIVIVNLFEPLRSVVPLNSIPHEDGICRKGGNGGWGSDPLASELPRRLS